MTQKMDFLKERTYRGVSDGREDVQLGESSQRVDGLQGSAKRLVEYVTDPSAAASVEDAQKTA